MALSFSLDSREVRRDRRLAKPALSLTLSQRERELLGRKIKSLHLEAFYHHN